MHFLNILCRPRKCANYPVFSQLDPQLTGFCRSGIGGILSHEKALLEGGVLGTTYQPEGLLPALMVSNAPQLILSCAYFAFNALYTRILAESEWQAFSMAYRPLRVTSPQGEQWSTYRLQLPYKYSIPLLGTSIFMHWITSNSIFIFITEGGELYPS